MEQSCYIVWNDIEVKKIYIGGQNLDAALKFAEKNECKSTEYKHTIGNVFPDFKIENGHLLAQFTVVLQ